MPHRPGVIKSLQLGSITRTRVDPSGTGRQPQDYGEERWVGIAPLGEGPLHTVVFTEIDDERARIISLRPSTTQEIHAYAAQKGKK